MHKQYLYRVYVKEVETTHNMFEYINLNNLMVRNFTLQ